MIDVKICGLTDAAGVDVAIAHGARYVGFVFFSKSPRHLEIEAAAALARRAIGRAEIVAVTVDASDDTLSAIAARVRPDYIQLHGRETPARTLEARRFAAKGVIKALSIARGEDLAQIEAFTDVADLFLFDAKAPPGAAMPGGNGVAFEWRLMRTRAIRRPWLLSGGLTAETLSEAVAESGARAVDVSSGVESAPGVKDKERIAHFIARARSLSEA